MTGADWIPSIDLARLAATPPATRKAVQRCGGWCVGRRNYICLY